MGGLIDELFAEIFIAKVARNGDGFASGKFDELDDFLSVRFFSGVIVDGDVGAFAGVGNGGGASHAGIATSNEGFSSGKSARAIVAFLAVVWNRIHFGGEAWPWLK